MLNSKQQQTLDHLKGLSRFDDFYLFDAFGYKKGRVHRRFIVRRGVPTWLKTLSDIELDALLTLSDDNHAKLSIPYKK